MKHMKRTKFEEFFRIFLASVGGFTIAWKMSK